jgi:predicted Zn-dependent protease
MTAIEPPESHHVNAASGWLDLGNLAEAEAELARLRPESQAHPTVLGLRWQLCARARQWEEAVRVARRLVEVDPEQAEGWINLAYALHELKRTEEAREVLLPLTERFREVVTIPYNLACYACQLDQLSEARRWLGQAVRLQGLGAIRTLALADEDLRPLWTEIAAWTGA